jgi:Family of unknown function (DUF5681)
MVGKMAFQKGKSGNPNGRPKGVRNRATIRAEELFEQMLFGEDNKASAIIATAIAKAEEGDATCIRICLDRIAPPRKDRPVCFNLPDMKEAKDTLSASMAIVAGVASGELTPSEASELAKVVESYARTLQAVAFEERLAKLEQRISSERALRETHQ